MNSPLNLILSWRDLILNLAALQKKKVVNEVHEGHMRLVNPTWQSISSKSLYLFFVPLLHTTCSLDNICNFLSLGKGLCIFAILLYKMFPCV